jgi:hypothetical protein
VFTVVVFQLSSVKTKSGVSESNFSALAKAERLFKEAVNTRSSEREGGERRTTK